MADGAPKDMTTPEIVSALTLFNQPNKIELKYLESYDKDKIDAALNALTPERINFIKKENYGCIPKIFAVWAVGYKDPGITPKNKWEIDQIILHVQKRLLDMPDLLSAKDSDTANSSILIATMVKNATPDIIEEIIIRPSLLKMLADAPGYNLYAGNTIAHLVVSRIGAGAYENGEAVYERKALELELMTELPDILILRNRNQERVLDMVERLAREWKDKDLIQKVDKVKIDMNEIQGTADPNQY